MTNLVSVLQCTQVGFGSSSTISVEIADPTNPNQGVRFSQYNGAAASMTGVFLWIGYN